LTTFITRTTPGVASSMIVSNACWSSVTVPKTQMTAVRDTNAIAVIVSTAAGWRGGGSVPRMATGRL